MIVFCHFLPLGQMETRSQNDQIRLQNSYFHYRLFNTFQMDLKYFLIDFQNRVQILSKLISIVSIGF